MMERRASLLGWTPTSLRSSRNARPSANNSSLKRSTAAALRHADDDGSPSRQFFIRDFSLEFEVETEAFGCSKGSLVEEVDYISSIAILEPSAFFEVEGARRIHFNLGIFAQDCSQIAMEA